MAIKEQNVILQSKNGNDITIDYPITSLKNINDNADTKTELADNDGVLISDSTDNNAVKKSLWSNIKNVLFGLFADKNHTHTKVNITDFPASLPANGGNADTVDGKHATDFCIKKTLTTLDEVNDLTLETGLYLVSGVSMDFPEPLGRTYYGTHFALIVIKSAQPHQIAIVDYFPCYLFVRQAYKNQDGVAYRGWSFSGNYGNANTVNSHEIYYSIYDYHFTDQNNITTATELVKQLPTYSIFSSTFSNLSDELSQASDWNIPLSEKELHYYFVYIIKVHFQPQYICFLLPKYSPGNKIYYTMDLSSWTSLLSSSDYIQVGRSSTNLKDIMTTNTIEGVSNKDTLVISATDGSDISSLIGRSTNTCQHIEGHNNKIAELSLAISKLTQTIHYNLDSNHIEGSYNTLGRTNEFAFGGYTYSLSNCHIEGSYNTATANNAHVEGSYNVASGLYSHAGGYYTSAHSKNMTAIGTYNLTTSTNCLLAIGNGTAEGARSDAFEVKTDSTVYGGTYNSIGADYAEYFEWQDGNPNNEDRRGLFVTLVSDKIRLATEKDIFILGVVSGNPSIIGDAQNISWNGMYEKDIFDAVKFHDVEVPAEYDDEGSIIKEAYIESRPILNPDYDNTQRYIPRSKRPEWACIGMMGKLVVVDDGTCVPDEYCKPSDGGKATYSDIPTRYRVMKRLDDTHIRILIF